MLHITTKKIAMSVLLFVAATFSAPSVVLAESSDTGAIAAGQAAQEREALAKKAAEKQAKKAALKAAEEKKAAETQPPAEAPAPAEEPKEKE